MYIQCNTEYIKPCVSDNNLFNGLFFFFFLAALFFFSSRVRVRKTVRHERSDALWFSFSTYIPISVCNITQCSEAIQIVLLLAESDCVHSNVVIHLGFERFKPNTHTVSSLYFAVFSW